MDAFTFAIRHVLNQDIPDRILMDAFIPKNDRLRRVSRSIEQAIREEVIEKKVMPDIASIGGVMVDVNLAGLRWDMRPNYERIYKIPYALTFNREIVQVLKTTLNVTSNFAERQPGLTQNTNFVAPIERSGQRVINSWRPVPNIANAQVEVLNDNVLKIRDFQNFTSDTTLTCLVAYSSDFSELSRPYYQDFCELVLAATKVVIFRKLDLEIEQFKLDGGRELGRYRERVDEYRDAFEVYKTLLNEKWSKILILMDDQRGMIHTKRAGRSGI